MLATRDVITTDISNDSERAVVAEFGDGHLIVVDNDVTDGEVRGQDLLVMRTSIGDEFSSNKFTGDNFIDVVTGGDLLRHARRRRRQRQHQRRSAATTTIIRRRGRRPARGRGRRRQHQRRRRQRSDLRHDGVRSLGLGHGRFLERRRRQRSDYRRQWLQHARGR